MQTVDDENRDQVTIVLVGDPGDLRLDLLQSVPNLLLQTIDVPAIVRLVSTVEQLRDQIREVDEKSEEELKKRREKLEKQLNEARATLLDVLGS